VNLLVESAKFCAIIKFFSYTYRLTALVVPIAGCVELLEKKRTLTQAVIPVQHCHTVGVGILVPCLA